MTAAEFDDEPVIYGCDETQAGRCYEDDAFLHYCELDEHDDGPHACRCGHRWSEPDQ